MIMLMRISRAKTRSMRASSQGQTNKSNQNSYDKEQLVPIIFDNQVSYISQHKAEEGHRGPTKAVAVEVKVRCPRGALSVLFQHRGPISELLSLCRCKTSRMTAFRKKKIVKAMMIREPMARMEVLRCWKGGKETVLQFIVFVWIHQDLKEGTDISGKRLRGLDKSAG